MPIGPPSMLVAVLLGSSTALITRIGFRMIARSDSGFTLGEGTYTLYVRANDVLNNVGPITSRIIRIDNSAPVLSIDYPSSGQKVVGTFTARWSATDTDGSGVVSYTYGISSGGDYSWYTDDGTLGEQSSPCLLALLHPGQCHRCRRQRRHQQCMV